MGKMRFGEQTTKQETKQSQDQLEPEVRVIETIVEVEKPVVQKQTVYVPKEIDHSKFEKYIESRIASIPTQDLTSLEDAINEIDSNVEMVKSHIIEVEENLESTHAMLENLVKSKTDKLENTTRKHAISEIERLNKAFAGKLSLLEYDMDIKLEKQRQQYRMYTTAIVVAGLISFFILL